MWWVLLFGSCIVFFGLVGYVLPTAFFKVGGKDLLRGDRGLKNYKEKNGRSIVYEPKPEYRKYIGQYIVSQRDGKKVIICKVDENIDYLDYDVVLFNRRNRAFKVINVKEKLEERGVTAAMELAKQTAYATIVINNVDGFHLNDHNDANGVVTTESKAFNRRLVLLSTAVAFLSMLEVTAASCCVAFIFGDVFSGDYIKTYFVDILFCSLIIAGLSFLAVFVWFKRKKKKGRAAERI